MEKLKAKLYEIFDDKDDIEIAFLIVKILAKLEPLDFSDVWTELNQTSFFKEYKKGFELTPMLISLKEFNIIKDEIIGEYDEPYYELTSTTKKLIGKDSKDELFDFLVMCFEALQKLERKEQKPFVKILENVINGKRISYE